MTPGTSPFVGNPDRVKSLTLSQETDLSPPLTSFFLCAGNAGGDLAFEVLESARAPGDVLRLPQLLSLGLSPKLWEIQSNQLRVFPSRAHVLGFWLPGDICQPPTSASILHPVRWPCQGVAPEMWSTRWKTATHTGPSIPSFPDPADFLLVSPLQLPGPTAGSTASSSPSIQGLLHRPT